MTSEPKEATRRPKPCICGFIPAENDALRAVAEAARAVEKWARDTWVSGNDIAALRLALAELDKVKL